MVGADQSLNGLPDLTMAPSGMLCQGCFAIHRLALATVNLPSKFEVFISTHYEDMKSDTKCRIWGGLG